jgi:hypothetical protein
MSKTAPRHSDRQVEVYERLIAGHPEIERTGANLPYTSLNRNTFTLLSPPGTFAIRLAPADSEQFTTSRDHVGEPRRGADAVSDCTGGAAEGLVWSRADAGEVLPRGRRSRSCAARRLLRLGQTLLDGERGEAMIEQRTQEQGLVKSGLDGAMLDLEVDSRTITAPVIEPSQLEVWTKPVPW